MCLQRLEKYVMFFSNLSSLVLSIHLDIASTFCTIYSPFFQVISLFITSFWINKASSLVLSSYISLFMLWIYVISFFSLSHIFMLLVYVISSHLFTCFVQFFPLFFIITYHPLFTFLFLSLILSPHLLINRFTKWVWVNVECSVRKAFCRKAKSIMRTTNRDDWLWDP